MQPRRLSLAIPRLSWASGRRGSTLEVWGGGFGQTWKGRSLVGDRLFAIRGWFTAAGRSQLASPWGPWSRRTARSGPLAGYGSRPLELPRNAQKRLRQTGG